MSGQCDICGEMGYAEASCPASDAPPCSTPIGDDPCTGETVEIYKYELQLLRKIAEAASDLVLGNRNAEFAKMNGGSDSLFDALAEVSDKHAQWMDGFEW